MRPNTRKQISYGIRGILLVAAAVAACELFFGNLPRAQEAALHAPAPAVVAAGLAKRDSAGKVVAR